MDSRQVSEATKGLRAVLHKNCVPPTGRRLHFITKATDDPCIQERYDRLIANHHEDIANERKLFRKIGASINSSVTLQNGKKLTLQQTLCSLSAAGGGYVFTGVERMGKTDTSLFTTHKKNLSAAKRTLHLLPQVLRRVLTPESFDSLGLGNPPQHEPEYVAMVQQEKDYLDGLLNLGHCTEIDINKKRKKDDETIGAHTAVSGLTNVSPQTQTTTGTGAWVTPPTLNIDNDDPASTPMNMDIDNAEPAATQVTSTLTTTHPDVAKLENETKQQKRTIVHMEKQIQSLQQSVQELVQYKAQEETHKKQYDEWRQTMVQHLGDVRNDSRDTKRRQVALQQDVSAVKQDLGKLVALMQRGTMSMPRPANPPDKSDDDNVIIQSQNPDPPPQGSRKI